ncbi:aldo/keto reductase family protein [Penicillium longicatenatum]|uniref:aldo/keto reductase family protein n=1 Tax=Penicillium longicatenatum TaxID=1561947 RepID=UPI002546C515|nr:aldo/keto reductase family protein [Penicillium longicatenatum]KAJ5630740.1 aldo/keto reductase family protein [Penicillium longicatenatum]
MATETPTKFKLNTGAEIPAIGFGTWQDEDAQEKAVLEAIKAGYKHIDTAAVYGTERAVGQAIKKCGVPREELFITTKLWNNKHHPDDVEEALQHSLNELGLEAMEKLLETGKAKAIGVSNFSKAELQKLLAKTSVVPAVHQMEFHPWLQQHEFSEWHNQKGIHITHYSPFGNQNTTYGLKAGFGKLIDEPVLAEIGKQYGKTAAQVVLAWGVSLGHSVLPKSKTPERIKSNLEGDFKLSPHDMEKISKLNRKIRFNDSSGEFGRDFFEDLEDKTG